MVARHRLDGRRHQCGVHGLANRPGLFPRPAARGQGRNSGAAVDRFLAQSRDGGRTWTRRRLSTVSSQPNYETYLDNRAPWRGDYIYLSAVSGGAYAVWVDSRDVVPGTDARPDSEHNGFDVFAPCAWGPSTVNGPPTGYLSPPADDPCLSQGGLDQNIYSARVERVIGPGCLARRSPIGPRSIGRVRLGYTRRRALRRITPQPTRRTGRSFRWCVKRSSRHVTADFGRGLGGRTRLVTSTARGHGMRGVRPGKQAGAFRRAFPSRRRIMGGLYRARPRSLRIFGLRRGEVRFVSVADRRLLRNTRALRRYLKLAGP
jgi:hypothetical protein